MVAMLIAETVDASYDEIMEGFRGEQKH